MRSSKSIMTGVAVLAALALPMVAGAANKLVVQDGSSNDKMVVTDTGKIGLGTNSPAFQFHVVGNGIDNGSAVGVITNPGRLPASYNAGDAPGLHFFRNNNVAINTGLPNKDDVLGNFGFGTIINGSYKWTALVAAAAEVNATTTSMPTYLAFSTAPANSFLYSEKARITSTGNVGIGTTTPAQKLEVNGGVRLNPTSGRPACSSSIRGTLWFNFSGAGVSDTLVVCVKNAADAYAWVQVINGL